MFSIFQLQQFISHFNIIMIGMKLCLFFTLLYTSLAIWQSLPQIRTDTIAPITFLTGPLVTATSVTFTFTAPITDNGTLTWGLGLIGYESYLTKTFSFNITINNVQYTTLSLTVQPGDDTYFLSMRLRYIISTLSSLTTQKMEVLDGCFKCTNITKGFGNRTEIFTQNSTLTASSSLTTSIFLYAFNMTNLYGVQNYLSVSTILSSGIYTHSVATGENNTISYTCITVITWDTSLNSNGSGVITYFASYMLDYANKSSLIPYMPSVDGMNLGFFGISMFNHSMGGNRLFGVYPEVYNMINSRFDSNNFINATLNVFFVGIVSCNASLPQLYSPTDMACVSSCTAGITVNISNICLSCNTNCTTCSLIPSNCTSCISGSNRNFSANCSCNYGYFDNQTSTCLLCSLSIQYCTACSSQTVCTVCDPGKFLVGTICKCLNTTLTTYLVSGVCLLYPGCITAATVINANYCSSCNTSANFDHPTASNLTCTCKSGYNNSGNPNVCSSICGDGLVDVGGCDDNNSISNDGCTNCTVDKGWYCYVTSGASGPSHCIQISSSSIAYHYAERIIGANTAKLYFMLSPANMSFPASTFQGKVQTNAPYSTLSATYDPTTSYITLQIQFTADMQANNYYFIFDFSSLTSFYAAPIQVSVTTNGINERLVFLNYVLLIKTLQYVLLGLSMIGIVIASISSLVGYKLIGLQLLLPLQAAFFTQLCIQNPPPYISQLKSLAFSNGYNQIVPFSYYKFYLSNSKLPKFNYQVQFGLNVNIMTALLVLSSLILLILQLVYLFHQTKAQAEQELQAPIVEDNKKGSKNKKQEKQGLQIKQQGQLGLKLKNSRQNRNTYINNFYFFIGVALMQQTIIAFIVQNMQVSVISLTIPEDINLLIGYFTLILVLGNVIFLICQLFQKKKRILIFQQTKVIKYSASLIVAYFCMALVISLINSFSFAPYIIVVFAAFPLIIFLFFRPYKHDNTMINTFSAVLDHAMILGCAVVYLFNSIGLSQMGWLASSLAVLGIILICQAVTIVRMVKVVPWKQLSLIKRCTKKGAKNNETSLLEKSKPQVELSLAMKENIISESNKMVNWQQRNKKEYESINSKPKNDDELQEQSQDKEEEDQLVQIKRRLKKEINIKRTIK